MAPYNSLPFVAGFSSCSERWSARAKYSSKFLPAVGCVALLVLYATDTEVAVDVHHRLPLEQQVLAASAAVHAKQLSASKKAAIAAQMKALRQSIDGDFKSMTHYGKEVGYLPPPENIEEQAKSGALFKSPDIPVPPPFHAVIDPPPLAAEGAAQKVSNSNAAAPQRAADASAHESSESAPSKHKKTGSVSAEADTAAHAVASVEEPPPTPATVKAVASTAQAIARVQHKSPPSDPVVSSESFRSPTTGSVRHVAASNGDNAKMFTDPPLFATPDKSSAHHINPAPTSVPPASSEAEVGSPKPPAPAKNSGGSDWEKEFSFMHHRADNSSPITPSTDGHEPPAVKGEEKYFLKAMHRTSDGSPVAAVVKRASAEKSSKPVWEKDSFLKGFFDGE